MRISIIGRKSLRQYPLVLFFLYPSSFSLENKSTNLQVCKSKVKRKTGAVRRPRLTAYSRAAKSLHSAVLNLESYFHASVSAVRRM